MSTDEMERTPVGHEAPNVLHPWPGTLEPPCLNGRDKLRVGPGRTVIRAGDRLTSIVIGVRGIVLVKGPQGQLTSCEAPFVLDVWAAHDDGLAQIEAVTQSDTLLLLVDYSEHNRMHEGSQLIRQLSAKTRSLVLAATESPEPANRPGDVVSQHVAPSS